MTSGFRVLIVEDDPTISDLIVLALRDLAAETRIAESAEAAVTSARQFRPDLVTLDLSLPDGDGTDVCRELRTFSDAYVVMITSRTDEIDRLVGLDVGADDYLAKPFSPRELRARASALLRRPRLGADSAGVHDGGPETDEPIGEELTLSAAGGRLVFDPRERVVVLDGERLMFTPGEVDLMAALVSSPGRAWSREELCRETFPGAFVESGFLLDVQVAGVRRKLRASGPDREWIATIAGSSYTLVP